MPIVNPHRILEHEALANLAHNHRQSEARSEAISGNQKQSKALIGNQKQSEALKGSQEQSEARIGNQKQSELIRALRSSQGNVRPLTCHQKPSA